MAGIVAAAGVAALMSGGQTLTVTNDIVSRATIHAVTRSITNCFQVTSLSQNLDIHTGGLPYTFFTEDPPAGMDPGEYKLHSGCLACRDAIKQIVRSINKLECDAHRMHPGYVVQVPNSEILNKLENVVYHADCTFVHDDDKFTADVAEDPASSSSDGDDDDSKKKFYPDACDLVCEKVFIQGISQTARIQAQTNCQVNNDFEQKLQQDVSANIKASLTNQQDIFGQLESAFTTTNDSVSNTLSQTITQNINDNFVQKLYTHLKARQSIKIGGGNDGNHSSLNSAYVSNIDQSMSASQIGNLHVVNQVSNQMKQSASYDVTQALLNKNDTTGDLTNDLLGILDNMSDLVENLVTKMLIIVGGVIICVAFVMLGRYIMDAGFRSWVQEKIEEGNMANQIKTSVKNMRSSNGQKGAKKAHGYSSSGSIGTGVSAEPAMFGVFF